MPVTNLHQTLLNAGLRRYLRKYRSDLYVVVNKKTSPILSQYYLPQNITYFTGQKGSDVSGLRCADIPFSWDGEAVDITRLGYRQKHIVRHALRTASGKITVHPDDIKIARSLVDRGMLASYPTNQDYQLTANARKLLSQK